MSKLHKGTEPASPQASDLRKQAEEMSRAQVELDAARARYFDLYDLAPVGYFTLSEQGLITEANLTAANLLGVNRGMLVKQPISRYILKEHQDIFYLHRKKLLETGELQACELRMVKKDGTAFWGHLVTTAALDPDGVLMSRVVINEITERKEAEEERENLRKQLSQGQKMESVGRLAGGMAHDFNNMLAVILGHAEMALTLADPSQPVHAHLTEIRKAADRSADLTRQLLAFARKQTVAPKVVNLNNSVTDMLKMLHRLIGEDIDLQWQPKADLWLVKIDPSQIDQILTNLCVNARDAIAGVGKITIEAENSTLDEAVCAAKIPPGGSAQKTDPDTAPGEYVRFAVRDDGCGMDKDTMSHIFEPFFTTKEMGKGTGLGLATVYGAVKQNNGFINVDSKPGQGTTFTIYIPRHIGQATQALTGPLGSPYPHDGVYAPKKPWMADVFGGHPPVRGAHETILLVEDEPSMLETTRMILEIQGYTVLAADTPDKATRLAAEHTGEIHLLITDVMMPGMNGRDLAKNLLSLCPQLKCLFMSGYTADIIAPNGILEEGVYFIQKPFDAENLAARIREVLDKK